MNVTANRQPVVVQLPPASYTITLTPAEARQLRQVDSYFTVGLPVPDNAGTHRLEDFLNRLDDNLRRAGCDYVSLDKD